MADGTLFSDSNVMKTVGDFSGVLGGLFFMTCCCTYLFRFRKKKEKEIIVFTRYPVAGKAKSRLIPAIGPVAAAKLQVLMTEHIVRRIQQYRLSNPDVSVTLQYNGGTHQQMKYWLDKQFHSSSCAYRPQDGTDLGEKLASAVKNSFHRGHSKVIVIGADIPGINEFVINDAFEQLGKDGTGVVIGPAKDGGYYLIGFTVDTKLSIYELFMDINWGTDQVFQQQMAKAEQLGATTSALSTSLQDIDTASDIEVFEEEVGVPVTQLTNPKWSVILPVLNEEGRILSTLNSIIKQCSNVDHLAEIVISDGGSVDGTLAEIDDFNQTSPVHVKVVHSKPGRGHQMIAGGKDAEGDHLLFLHADTRLPAEFDVAMCQCLAVPGNVAGAFEFQLDIMEDKALQASEPWWFLQQMSMLVWGARRRSENFEMPYGDQGLFMTKDVYKTIGGYPPYYLMEDYITVEKLKEIGHIGITKGYAAVTSYRRWRKYGYIRTTGLTQIIVRAYRLGVHPNTLAKWYYGKRLKID